jgi:amidohydrolase
MIRFAPFAASLLSCGLALLTSPFLAPALAQPLAVPQAVRAKIDQAVTELTPTLIETRRDLHRHPELGYREKRTSELIAAKLRALKFDEVRTGIGVTGVVGILKGGKPGKIVAVRADMDALPIPELIDVPYKSTVPNVKHACGHDGHVSIALVVAEVFSRLRSEIPGTVMFMFQPAEEGDPDGGKTGALRMLDDGLFKSPKPAAIFGLHVLPQLRVGTIGLRAEGAMANADRFTIDIVGKKTHGAYPHTGIDPVPVAAQVVLGLQTIVSRQANATEPIVLSVGSINGGNRYNIIADTVRLEGTVRTLTKEGPAWAKERMDAVLKGITSSYGATYTMDYRAGAPVTFNDPALVTASRPAMVAVAGEKNVILPPLQMGAEDFGYYQQQMPGVFFFLGVGNPEKKITAMIHTEHFDMDEDALPLGARAMSTTVLDYLYR